MFQSPLHFCEVRKTWVALDQSVEQCRVANGCAGPCPHCRYFLMPADAVPRDHAHTRMWRPGKGEPLG